MRQASSELIALLGSSTQFLMADLYTITLASGTVLRYTNADASITSGGNTYASNGPLIKRGTVRIVRGLEVDSLNLTISASRTESAHWVDGVPLVEAAMKGVFDGATLLLRRAFLSTWSAPPVGTVVLFSGRVSSAPGSRSEVRMTVKSDIELLNVRLPRNLYQSTCLHTVYDGGCAVSKAAFTVSGAVTANNGTGQWLQSNLSQQSSWFDQGVISFGSGPNAGQQRTVKAYAAGAFWFALPLPHVPAVGDTFTVRPGCDKTQATCAGKFGNLPRYRGYPYIPIPESAT